MTLNQICSSGDGLLNETIILWYLILDSQPKINRLCRKTIPDLKVLLKLSMALAFITMKFSLETKFITMKFSLEI